MKKLSDKELNSFVGSVFGDIVVTQYIGHYKKTKGDSRRHWFRCMCKNCGNTEYITSRKYLLYTARNQYENTTCGCKQYEGFKKGIRYEEGVNTYHEHQDGYLIGMTQQGEKFYFDKESYSVIKDYYWYISPEGYVVSNNPKGVNLKFHRLILNAEDHVDHINGVRNDNRLANLRECIQADNNLNRKINKNNTSGIKGVSWVKKQEKWQAQIGYRGKVIHLGSYNDIKEAEKVRKEAEKKYFGDFNRSKEEWENGECTRSIK